MGVGVEDEEEQKEFSPYLGEGLNIADIRSRPRFYQGQAYRLMSDGGRYRGCMGGRRRRFIKRS